MIDGDVEDKEVNKYLQINLYEDFLNKVIKEESTQMYNSGQIQPKKIKRLAELKVARKGLRMQKPGDLRLKGFKNDKEILEYSWDLFRDKINSKVPMLAQPNDPCAQFNLRKFNEYTYPVRGDEDCDPPLSVKEMHEQWREQEEKILHACSNRERLKHTPATEALNRVLADLSERQSRGLLRKQQFSNQQKNATALKFVELHAKV